MAQRRFAQRAVLRFMPGEDVEAAMNAAQKLGSQGMTSVFTQLGEDIADRDEAASVTAHYRDLMGELHTRKLRTHISVKLTQLGLEIDQGFCVEQVTILATAAAEFNNVVWIDIEGSPLVDATLDVFRAVRADHVNVGLCLQAYLHRTPDDLDSLLQIGARIRLVKGAYREPPSVAIASKSAVDTRYLELSKRLLQSDARRNGVVHGIATHDLPLIRQIKEHARATGVPREAFEFQMLYGIRANAQQQLAAEGYPMRTLISYGSAWFAWYMRRLAERPANLWFVAKSMLG